MVLHPSRQDVALSPDPGLSRPPPSQPEIVFEGESDGIRVRVVWGPADPETVLMFTLAPGEHTTSSRPLECHQVKPRTVKEHP